MKKLAIVVGVLLVVLLVAVVLAPFLIDLNAYKNYYQPKIEEALNRKIVLTDLRLTLMPQIGVRIAGFTVLDDPAFSKEPFASLESLDIGLKFMPLLRGRVEVDNLELNAPVISVIKNQQGLFNVSTIGTSGPSAPEPPKDTPSIPQEGEGPLRALALLAVDRVTIRHGRLSYLDQTASIPSHLTAQDLNVLLKSVRLGDTPSLHLDAVLQPFNLPFKVDGIVGPLVEMLDLKTIDIALALGNLSASITGSAVGGHARLTIASPMISTADLPVALPLVKPVHMKDVQINLETDYPIPPDTPPLEAATVNVLHFSLILGNAVVAVDGSILDGKATLLATSPAVATTDLPIILPLRKPVDMKDLKLSMGMKGQRAEIDKLSATIFGGQLLADMRIVTGPSHPPFEGTFRLQGIQLGPLLSAVTDTLTASGTANAQLAMQGQGFSKRELLSGLAGKGAVTVKDGAIEGVNLLQEALALLKAAGIRLNASKATVFSAIDGRFGLKQGVVQVDRLFMDSHDFQALGTGTIGLDHTLNLKTGLTLSEALSKQITATAPALRVAMTGTRLTVPMIITGTTQSPSYGLDTKVFSGKVQERVKEQVKGVVDDLLQGKQPDLQKGKEALKNLFGP